MLASMAPIPSISKVSTALPEGRSLPVAAPPGSMNSRVICAPAPETPGSSNEPLTPAAPSSTGKRAWYVLPVFVLWTRTVAVSPPTTRTRPSSTANGPTALEMFPQVPT